MKWRSSSLNRASVKLAPVWCSLYKEQISSISSSSLSLSVTVTVDSQNFKKLATRGNWALVTSKNTSLLSSYLSVFFNSCLNASWNSISGTFRSSRYFFHKKIIFLLSICPPGQGLMASSRNRCTISSGVWRAKKRAWSTRAVSGHCAKNLSAEP